MARVETVVAEVPPAPAAPLALRTLPDLITLDPNEIEIGPTARPGPDSPDERRSIELLARDIRERGQIVPVVVEPAGYGSYRLIDGARRLAAVKLIGRPICCVVRMNDLDSLQTAIHANLKRRGYTPLQFALLCAQIQRTQGWSGTKEVAAYVGVSRAQVSQHLKLLHKPPDMPTATYNDLLERVNQRTFQADAAFYTFTHVEPAKAEAVIDRAEQIAYMEEVGNAGKAQEGPSETGGSTPTTSDGSKNDPDAPQAAKTGSTKATRKPKKTSKPSAGSKPVVTKAHVRQAAAEKQAETYTGHTLQRTIPEMRKLAEALRSTAYPDVMRNFISTWFGAWWRGDAKDNEVIAHWTAIARIVEAHEEAHRHTAHEGRK